MTISTRVLLLLTTCIAFVPGCRHNAATAPTPVPKQPAVSVAPKQPAQGDTWCQYTITAQTPACGRNRVGETICILCTRKFAPNQLCPNPPARLVVSPAQGCEFTLLPLAPGQQQCENCTAREGGTYQESNKPG